MTTAMLSISACHVNWALLLIHLMSYGSINAFSTSTYLNRLTNYVSPSIHPQHSLIFPIDASTATKSSGETRSKVDIGNLLSRAFDTMVDSSNFMESLSVKENGHQLSSCTVPTFGDSAKVTFEPCPSTCDADGNPTEYILFAFEFDHPIDDFGMLCLEMYRHRSDIQNVFNIDGLETNILDYMNSRPPDPGMAAGLTSSEAIGSNRFGSILDQLIDPCALLELQKHGYAVIDNVMKTSQSSNDQLGEWANKGKTGQDDCRSDTVAFLDRRDALECGLEDQFDFLLTLASHLNDNFDLYASPYKPVFPGTTTRPLTNPKGFNVQMAEYVFGDYYNPHSDNSIDREVDNGAFGGTAVIHDYLGDDAILPKKRSNWRCITAILYLNEGWKTSDGGQLRMYLDSAHVESPSTARDTHEYIDVNPSNGKLLLFDSRMVHSVEEVLNENKIRRALTLWITRPEESGVSGEDYFMDISPSP